jgi:hypothetical protein
MFQQCGTTPTLASTHVSEMKVGASTQPHMNQDVVISQPINI